MHHALRLAVCTAALMATPALAQEEQPPQEGGAAVVEEPSLDTTQAPAATDTQPAEGAATDTQPAEGAATETPAADAGAAAAPQDAATAVGDPQQALTAAAEQLNEAAQQLQSGGMATDATGTGAGATTDATGTGGVTGEETGAAAGGTMAVDGTGGADMQQMTQQATQALDQFDQAVQQFGSSEAGQQSGDQVAQMQQMSQQAREQLQTDPQQASQTMQELAGMAMQQQTAAIPAEADAIIGNRLVSSDGEEAGEVTDVLITPDGQVSALILRRGGALGIGGTQVAVDWEMVQLQGDQLLVNMTSDQIDQLPDYQTD